MVFMTVIFVRLRLATSIGEEGELSKKMKSDSGLSTGTPWACEKWMNFYHDKIKHKYIEIRKNPTDA